MQNNEQDLVNCPEVDLVVVSVKVEYHFKLVKAAIEAGKMIYCEWPLANGTREAEELTVLAKAKGIRAFVGLQFVSMLEILCIKKVRPWKFLAKCYKMAYLLSSTRYRFAHQAVLNDLFNDTHNFPFFEEGLRYHRLLDNITRASEEGKTLNLVNDESTKSY